MAEIISTVDDLHMADGKEVAATVKRRRLAYGDAEVLLDLTQEHDDELARLLAPYLDAGRPQTRPRYPAGRAGMHRRTTEEYEALRAWADRNGLGYTDRSGKNDYKRIMRKWDAHKAATGLVFP